MSLEKVQQTNPENSQEQQEKTIEQQANYEGNHSLLLFERIQNPDVFNKLVNDIYEDRTSVDFSSYDYIDPEYVKSLERDEYFVKQDIKIELQQALETTSKSTEIGFSENGYLNSSKGISGTGYVEICSSDSKNQFNETTLNKNITEAHEKGHTIRGYNTDSGFTENLRSAFDFEKVSFSEEEYNEIRGLKNGYENDSNDEIQEGFSEYLSFPWEIVERMSQVKNYFGMSGFEEFTQEHLDYVRKNYVQDTGSYGPQIQPFFDSITDDEKFINLMNTLGI
jgi:hypothetical protein